MTDEVQLADFEHPIIQVLRRVVQTGGEEKYELSEAGENALREILLVHADDDSLPGGLIALFGMIAAFHRDENSSTAARKIFLLVGELEPQLTALRRADGPIRDQLERSFRNNKFFEAPPRRAPGLNEQAPAGSLKVTDFLPPGSGKLR